MIHSAVIDYLTNSEEPWTRYRTLLDLLDLSASDPEVQKTRAAMLAHPKIHSLITKAAGWGEQQPIKRHNDANHPIYALLTLSDFGLTIEDDGILPIAEQILARQSAD